MMYALSIIDSATAPTDTSTLSLHDALPILKAKAQWGEGPRVPDDYHDWLKEHVAERHPAKEQADPAAKARAVKTLKADYRDRKSTRLNSSHLGISYAVFCLKKKTKKKEEDI